MKKLMSIAVIALLTAGASVYACDSCGCKAKKAAKKAECTATGCTKAKACDKAAKKAECTAAGCTKAKTCTKKGAEKAACDACPESKTCDKKAGKCDAK